MLSISVWKFHLFFISFDVSKQCFPQAWTYSAKSPVIEFFTMFSIYIVVCWWAGWLADITISCAQLLHFSRDFDQIFHRSFVIQCPGASFFGVLWFEHFWQNFTLLFSTPASFLKQFCLNFHRGFAIEYLFKITGFVTLQCFVSVFGWRK